MNFKMKLLIIVGLFTMIGLFMAGLAIGQTKPVTFINAQKALKQVSQLTPLPCTYVVIDGTTYVIMVEGDIIKTLKPIPCKIY